jgi:hypothetical protein
MMGAVALVGEQLATRLTYAPWQLLQNERVTFVGGYSSAPRKGSSRWGGF